MSPEIAGQSVEEAVIAERDLQDDLRSAFRLLETVAQEHQVRLHAREIGIVKEVEGGIVRVVGVPNVQADELLVFEGNRRGFAFNLDRHEVGCVMLDDCDGIRSGTRVERTGSVLEVPVGEELLGRTVDPLGRPLDDGPAPTSVARLPCERDAPRIMQRAPVEKQLLTGIKVIDSLIPIGRGQRQLILGDRQTGKTAIAIDTIINQIESGVVCVYCSIGQRSTNLARVVEQLKQHGALDRCVIVVGRDDAPPGLQFIAPYAATSIAESFMARGRDVLVVYDDLTAHGRAYRHLSLLLRRPPGREAFPADIFYVHARLLERATHFRDEFGGGSLTALPIIETEAQNVSAYIPTNLISITDGQIYLSPHLFHKGVLPAVDVGRSVSRVGGKTQLAAYRSVAADLRLTYSQFEELERFARFSSHLDEDTRATLERGRAIREMLKQPVSRTLTAARQITSLVAVTRGTLDQIAASDLPRIEHEIHQAVELALPDLQERIQKNERLSDEDIDSIVQVVNRVLAER